MCELRSFLNRSSPVTKISIASLLAPTSVGGLASYQQRLAEGLFATARYDVSLLALTEPSLPSLAVMNSGRMAVEMVPGRNSFQSWTPVLRSLASRPLLLPVLRMLMNKLLSPSKLAARLQNTQALHFVGTGWDFLGFSLMKAARTAGTRFTIWPAVHPKNWGDDQIDISLYSQADAIFCQSDYEKRHLESLGVPVAKLVRCGLPPMCKANGDGERLRQSLDISKRPTVLFLGRRDEGKGYPALLEAWPLVLRQCSDAVLLLAGPGDADQQRLSLIPPANVRDLGCPDEQRKADAYAACDVFCLPSAHESFGIVYVEAWSYGKPVLCGTAPASRELVEDGVTGVWADQQPQQLASSLLRLLLDPEYALQLGVSGMQHQRMNYTAEHMLDSHMKAWGAVSLN